MLFAIRGQVAAMDIDNPEIIAEARAVFDRYEEALKALIEEKQKGHKPARVAEPEDTNVIDLMSALRASLGGKSKPAAKSPKAKAKAKPAEKAAAKPRAKKSA